MDRKTAEIFARYDRANADPSLPSIPEDVFEDYVTEVRRVLTERPSPGAVAEAFRRWIEHSIDDPIAMAALVWLAAATAWERRRWRIWRDR